MEPNIDMKTSIVYRDYIEYNIGLFTSISVFPLYVSKVFDIKFVAFLTNVSIVLICNFYQWPSNKLTHVSFTCHCPLS